MIRSLEKTDYIQFTKLINTNISEEVFNLFINGINANKHIIVVYEENNNLIGTGTLLIETKLTYNICYLGHIENIFIHNDYRNKGYGKQIIKYLIDKAKNKQCYRIDLACENKLENYYEKLGFNRKLTCMSLLNIENFK
jgi:N-acetylglutamate synthase-like GNAT family acetyltransferase